MLLVKGFDKFFNAAKEKNGLGITKDFRLYNIHNINITNDLSSFWI